MADAETVVIVMNSSYRNELAELNQAWAQWVLLMPLTEASNPSRGLCRELDRLQLRA